jgi:hypothetical protein
MVRSRLRVLSTAGLCSILIACSASADPSRPATPTPAPATLRPQATVTLLPSPGPPTSTPLPSAVIRGTGADGLSLRPAPGSSERLAVIAEGASITLTGEEQSAEGRTWKEVKTADDRAGWVAAEFLEGPGTSRAPPP